MVKYVPRLITKQSRRPRFKADRHRSAVAMRAAQESLAAEWKQQVRCLPAGKREAWLKQSTVIAAFGTARRNELIARVSDERLKLERRVPSESWFVAAFEEGHAFPPPGMRLSRSKVQYSSSVSVRSDEVIGHRRYYPPNNLTQENGLDAMTTRQADECTYDAPSPSAVAIHRIIHYGATQVGGRDSTVHREERLNRRR